ncbi:MAG: hypothetical protein H0W72_14210, partial [Planctomycetes bacterium]|nr:hypothetical protein [Planctomycetota bacterium]
VRWTSDSWWVRVIQRSDFATREQVPTWDHPWEALRLLHTIAPHAGPALGWKAPPPLLAPLHGDEAEQLHRDGLLLALAGRGCSDDDALRLREHLAVPADAATLRARLAWLLARAQPATPDQDPGYGRWRLGVPSRRLQEAATKLLASGAAQRVDPYCVLPASVTFAETYRPVGSRWSSASIPAPRRADDDLLVAILDAQRCVRPPVLGPGDLARVLEMMPEGSAPPRDLGFDVWWNLVAAPWLAAQAEQGR